MATYQPRLIFRCQFAALLDLTASRAGVLVVLRSPRLLLALTRAPAGWTTALAPVFGRAPVLSFPSIPGPDLTTTIVLYSIVVTHCCSHIAISSERHQDRAPGHADTRGQKRSLFSTREKDRTKPLTGHTKSCLHDHAAARSSASSPNPVADGSVSRPLGTR
jgi:hypothetical protein